MREIIASGTCHSRKGGNPVFLAASALLYPRLPQNGFALINSYWGQFLICMLVRKEPGVFLSWYAPGWIVLKPKWFKPLYLCRRRQTSQAEAFAWKWGFFSHFSNGKIKAGFKIFCCSIKFCLRSGPPVLPATRAWQAEIWRLDNNPKTCSLK